VRPPDLLGRHGINATGWPWETEEDQNAMFDAVANGTFDALVLDNFVLEVGSAGRRRSGSFRAT
jgi:ABC-type amino acid transport substrate-binding protein